MVARAAKVIPNSKVMYYKIRNTDPNILNPVDRAARFVFLNRFCFNGVYRVNKRGQFNVPRGYRTGQIQDESMFYRYSLLLRSVGHLEWGHPLEGFCQAKKILLSKKS